MLLNNLYYLCSVFIILLMFPYKAKSSDIVITILSQNNDYSVNLATNLKKLILSQTVQIHNSRLGKVQLLHEEFPDDGSWTIIPIVKSLILRSTNAKWFLFCEENSYVDYENLLKLISKYDHNKPIWLGYGLKDKIPSIVHHYMFENDEKKRLTYPLFAAGFLMSMELLSSVVDKSLTRKPSATFSIDASFELAQLIDHKLIHMPFTFCLKQSSTCVVHPQTERYKCERKVAKGSIYFAVKTCKKYHNSRIPVLKSTWGGDAVHIEYFSDQLDPYIPTVIFPNTTNTETGFCLKTMSIIKYLSEKLAFHQSLKWIVITDDDTLLSVSRLASILSCWDEHEIALGQRYGYNVRGNPSLGYNYITGGGGIVLSMDLVHKLTKCQCDSPQSPDDMVLGICLKSLNATVVHSPVFHQARPQDYADEYLEAYPIVSFHKHVGVDPLRIYRYWLYQDSSFGHDEL